MDSSVDNRDVGVRTTQKLDKLEGITVLLVFLIVAIIGIYLLSMLLIFFRKFKSIFKTKHSARAYYMVVFFYIISKIILCAILMIEIISQTPNQWENLKAEDIQFVLKNSIELANLSLILLFLIALYSYLQMCFLTMDKRQTKKKKRTLLYGIKIMAVIAILAFMIPLIMFDFKEIQNYELLNGIATGFNALVVLIFLAAFFYLNFKMTGLMVQQKLNFVIKKLYKVQAIILISRIMMIAVELIMAFKIHDGSFHSFIQSLQEINGQFVTFGLVFLVAIVIILLTQGLPMMYSLKNSVLQAFLQSHKLKQKPGHAFQSIITSNSSVNQELLKDDIFQYDQEPDVDNISNLSLARFKNLYDLKDKQDTIWNLKRGQISNQEFIVKVAKHEISNYIIQDLETEIGRWNELKLTHLNSITYFRENQHICIVQKFVPYNLDIIIDKIEDEKDICLLALDIARGIQEIHKSQIAHGSLKPSYILLSKDKKVFFTGLGLLSLKKYLSLTTAYTNKSMYSAVQILADKNNVTVKPTKQSDIYSFGMILYEMVTKNRIYREQTLKQCKQKFHEQKARPKIPQDLNLRLKALIRNCWQDEASKRPSISQVIINIKKIIQQS